MKLLHLLPLFTTLTAASSRIIPRTIPTNLSVENFVRNCSVVDTCDYRFIIDYSPYGSAPCTIHDVKNDPKVNVSYKQFFGVGCIEVFPLLPLMSCSSNIGARYGRSV
jgi:hypothetical protein